MDEGMPVVEGPSRAEVGNEIGEPRQPAHAAEPTGRDRAVSIIEATLLATVALLAAWSGYASAKWSTESRLVLGEASTARAEANRATALDAETLNFDASTFNTWFSAYVVGNQQAMDVAVRRFRPEFHVAYDAWIKTDPFTNDDAPSGPTSMPEYQRPHRDRAQELDAMAEERFKESAEAAETADEYVRVTVLLATVLFMVGISGHFRVRAARYGLVTVGAILLVLAVLVLITYPKPPL